MKFIVTGSAGFIGFHLARRLLADGQTVHGIDGFTAYYDRDLKHARNKILEASDKFTPHVAMLEDMTAVHEIFERVRPDIVVHLAAQAGVRYSLTNPSAYIESNLVGTFNILELVRKFPVRHLIAASTSSVYGMETASVFAEQTATDRPVSLYAATKKSTEVISHAYSHLFGIPTTFTRFFTVYGPWGRPDMALYSFVADISKGRPIDVYGEGRMSRDFTYIDDVVEALSRLVDVVPSDGGPQIADDTLSPIAPWRVVNIGNGAPVKLMDFVASIEKHVGAKANIRLLPMQPGDVASTHADTRLLQSLTGFQPNTSLDDGVGAFMDWYRDYTATTTVS